MCLRDFLLISSNLWKICVFQNFPGQNFPGQNFLRLNFLVGFFFFTLYNIDSICHSVIVNNGLGVDPWILTLQHFSIMISVCVQACVEHIKMNHQKAPGAWSEQRHIKKHESHK